VYAGKENFEIAQNLRESIPRLENPQYKVRRRFRAELGRLGSFQKFETTYTQQDIILKDTSVMRYPKMIIINVSFSTTFLVKSLPKLFVKTITETLKKFLNSEFEVVILPVDSNYCRNEHVNIPSGVFNI
jgi:hypothetical protein